MHHRPVKVSSKLKGLNPIIDDDQIIRVGGRLNYSSLRFTAKHPIILPKNNPVVDLIIRHEHLTNAHAGTQTTLYLLRRQYWIIDGRSQVWKIVKKCIKCCRANPPRVEYLMGALPAPRVTESRPFTHVGIDYCGPFLLKEKKFRNKKSVKVYVAVFVCLAIKAVHLEVVCSLTTESFIGALRRFVARRGNCVHIYSDNGTNFVGANRELKEIIAQQSSESAQKEIQEFLVSKAITWHFNPPASPNFGGLWEAAVKSFKYHFKRVAGTDLTFTYEEFNTLTIDIEAILNSRPLTPLSSDPNDPIVLTPNHFLIGEQVTDLPEVDLINISSNKLSTWQHLQQVKQHFWKRWRLEYLNELTTRNKWNRGHTDAPVNSIVLLRDDNVPPMSWPMGRIIEMHPGDDGLARVATIKTAKNYLKSSLKNLVILPEQCT